ncbi:oligosaccharide flippase family protein [Halobacillus sp. HZG1]|uniref:lipopolysaccharide biosynthesis protein n=1 Tax=Halobacillus sp. HZG1 TaxID=3111769 RepID=UPI002DB60255|nr:oligosaccharide flippase family protein [Halobacillus sp. HZG1]MEC3884059.1 oligosaccharide flippase family protein [Halobacillus sp. HZG1]
MQLGSLKLNNLSNLKKSILVLFSGNILSQIILFSATPILTRLYSPENFGVLASFTALLSILLALSTLSFEKIIPLIVNDKLARSVVYLSIKILCFFTLIIFIFLFVYKSTFLGFFNVEELIIYYWIIPLSLFFAGCYKIFNFYAIRISAFKDISISKISQSLSQIVIQISMALIASSNALWLLLGDSVGRSAGVIRLSKEFFKSKNTPQKKIKRNKLQRLILAKYKSFSFQSTLSDLLNATTMQIPILLIGMLYDPYYAGLFLLSQRIIGLPITLITKSISQVYYGEAIKLFREGPVKLLRFFKQNVIKLFLFSLIPFIIIGAVAPPLVTYLLGDDWGGSGRYIQFLIPMFLAQLAITPLGQTLFVIKATGYHLLWEVSRLILLVSGMLLAYLIDNNNVNYLIIGISLSMSISYVFYFIITVFNLTAISKE